MARFLSKVKVEGKCWRWQANKNPDGYGRFQIRTKQNWLAHRASYELFHEPIPPGMEVDHVCHNRDCVNPEHLRLATRKQNLENQSGAYKTNKSSGIRGVSWTKATNSWTAKVTHNGEHHVRRGFTDLAEAEAAAIAMRLELFTHNVKDREVA